MIAAEFFRSRPLLELVSTTKVPNARGTEVPDSGTGETHHDAV